MNSGTSIEQLLVQINVTKAELTVRMGYTSNVVYKWGKTISAPPAVMLYLKALRTIKRLEDDRAKTEKEVCKKGSFEEFAAHKHEYSAQESSCR